MVREVKRSVTRSTLPDATGLTQRSGVYASPVDTYAPNVSTNKESIARGLSHLAQGLNVYGENEFRKAKEEVAILDARDKINGAKQAAMYGFQPDKLERVSNVTDKSQAFAEGYMNMQGRLFVIELEDKINKAYNEWDGKDGGDIDTFLASIVNKELSGIDDIDFLNASLPQVAAITNGFKEAFRKHNNERLLENSRVAFRGVLNDLPAKKLLMSPEDMVALKLDGKKAGLTYAEADEMLASFIIEQLKDGNSAYIKMAEHEIGVDGDRGNLLDSKYGNAIRDAYQQGIQKTTTDNARTKFENMFALKKHLESYKANKEFIPDKDKLIDKIWAMHEAKLLNNPSSLIEELYENEEYVTQYHNVTALALSDKPIDQFMYDLSDEAYVDAVTDVFDTQLKSGDLPAALRTSVKMGKLPEAFKSTVDSAFLTGEGIASTPDFQNLAMHVAALDPTEFNILAGHIDRIKANAIREYAHMQKYMGIPESEAFIAMRNKVIRPEGYELTKDENIKLASALSDFPLHLRGAVETIVMSRYASGYNLDVILDSLKDSFENNTMTVTDDNGKVKYVPNNFAQTTDTIKLNTHNTIANFTIRRGMPLPDDAWSADLPLMDVKGDAAFEQVTFYPMLSGDGNVMLYNGELVGTLKDVSELQAVKPPEFEYQLTAIKLAQTYNTEEYANTLLTPEDVDKELNRVKSYKRLGLIQDDMFGTDIYDQMIDKLKQYRVNLEKGKPAYNADPKVKQGSINNQDIYTEQQLLY